MAKVYIGVGHGGSDSGAVKYLVEKDVNLKMAKACRNYLKAAGVETKISHETDKDSSIAEKVTAANNWGADLALDIHNNAGGGDGAEVYHSIIGGTGKKLAENILAEVEKIGQNIRGAKTKEENGSDYFGFIRMTNMPAVITEMVFVDNAADAAQADTDKECNAFGEAIAKGVLKTLGIEYKPTSSKPTVSSKPAVTATSSKFKAYKVKVTTSALNIRKGPGTNYGKNGMITDYGVYTITAEKSGQGAKKWGKLKSGAGWIALDFTKKV